MNGIAELESMRQKIAAARRTVGPSAWLLQYDANEIQELVTANSRPIAMRGASQTIVNFDEEQRVRPLTIFAGGGRGMELARSREEALARTEALRERFQAMTHGGVVACAAVPFDSSSRESERKSLSWLRLRLQNAKDEAQPPGGALAADKASLCDGCGAFKAVKTRKRDDQEEQLCQRCAAMIGVGGRTEESRQSLADVGSRHQIAALSADGNNLSVFFSSLRTLEEQAAASLTVFNIFSEAHHLALERIEGANVSPVTGGDDIRAFISPEDVCSYVEHLASEVESRATRAGDLRGLLSKDSALALSQLGVGVGAVVADDHYPASRLMGHAHELEDISKSICRTGTERAREPARARSAFAFSVLRNGEFQHPSAEQRQKRGLPLSLEAGTWGSFKTRAQALARVPPSQRMVLSRIDDLSEEEFFNLLRYQVARSRPWQAYFDACNVDWRAPGAIQAQCPDGRTLDFIRLMRGTR